MNNSGEIVGRILETMRKKHISAKELTSSLEISNSSLTDWKKGSRPSAEVIGKIAEYLGVSTDFIILGKEDSSSLSSGDQQWLTLIHSLSPETQRDFFGAMRLHAELHDIVEKEETELRQAK